MGHRSDFLVKLLRMKSPSPVGLRTFTHNSDERPDRLLSIGDSQWQLNADESSGRH